MNRYSGKWLFATGMVTVVAALGMAGLPGLLIDTYALAVLAVFTISFAISIVASVRYMNLL